MVLYGGLLFVAATADAQQRNRDYYEAKLTRASAEYLRNVEKFHIEPGIRKMQAGSYAYALQDFEFILSSYPNHPRGLALLSELCDVKWKGPRCDSEAWFRRAIETNPHAPQTFVVNGVHLQRLNRIPEAIESYKRAIALDPSSGNAHYNLALAYLEQRQFEIANLHAQLAYALGMPYPALRDKLTQAGHWRPIDPDQIKQELAPKADGGKDPTPSLRLPAAPSQ